MEELRSLQGRFEPIDVGALPEVSKITIFFSIMTVFGVLTDQKLCFPWSNVPNLCGSANERQASRNVALRRL